VKQGGNLANLISGLERKHKNAGGLKAGVAMRKNILNVSVIVPIAQPG